MYLSLRIVRSIIPTLKSVMFVPLDVRNDWEAAKGSRYAGQLAMVDQMLDGSLGAIWYDVS
jgi:hypothetical protein